MNPSRPIPVLLAATWTLGALFLQAAAAGGGPETTLVVVNADSDDSRHIANAYASLRDIPDSHLVWLQDIPTAPRIDIETFRQRIWAPIREYMHTHRLEESIDLIAYSAGFPYAVDFRADLRAKKLPKNKLRGRVGSLTGLTYFARGLEHENIVYLGPNLYFRRDVAPTRSAPRRLTEAEKSRHKAAMKAFKRRDFEDAAESLGILVGAYPWDAQVWYDYARSLAALQRDGEALQALERGVEAGWSHSLTARSDRWLKRLHGQPRFQRLLERMRTRGGMFQLAHGFRGTYSWHGHGLPVKTGGHRLSRYFLSVLLAYTGDRGNSVPEVLDYLRRAAASDGTRPDGTVYLMENPNIRAQTRERYFHATSSDLAKRGRRVEITRRGVNGEDGVLPRNRADVMGVVVGAAKFDWARSKSRLLPGAIAESLTSYGGHFARPKQTKLSEFLRHGAAGSSGAVAEPFSVQAKFPVSQLHVHYADGSSLAEAFYQSVAAPYQLLIVGDPLARPFARFATLVIQEPNPHEPWRGTVLIRPRIEPPPEHSIERIELWVDGRYVDDVASWDVLLWDTQTVDDGYHDVRLVAVDAGRIETRSYTRADIEVANTSRRVAITTSNPSVPLGQRITLGGTAAQAKEVHIHRGTSVLQTAPVHDGRWTATVASQDLGPGPVRLFARATYTDGVACRSRPVQVEVVAAGEPIDSR